MSARVSVRLDGPDGDVVAVKTATTPEELGRLTYEATQLRRASHPGVVSLVGQFPTDDGAELHTRFAGQPLDRWRGNLPRLAGLGAAVAATLADLHELGIVHGRLDGTHVLLGSDGRPRLCGFSPAGDPAPPDDVAALGRLLAALADQIPLSDRRGLLAWRRGPLAERRAFDHLVGHATDPVPTRRPSARAFATSLLAAVTDAELPPAGHLPSPADPRPEIWAPPGDGHPDSGVEGDDGVDRPPPDTREGHRARPAMNGERDGGDHHLPRPAGGDVSATDAAGGEGRPASGPPPHGRGGVASGGGPGREEVASHPDQPVLVGDDGDLTDPDWSGYDDVFGDQTQVGLDDVFVDRPWPGFREPTARLRRPHRHRVGDRGHRLVSRAAVLAAAAVAFTALLVWLDVPPEGDSPAEPWAAPEASETPTTDPCRAPGGAPGPGETGSAAGVGAGDEGGSAAGAPPEAQADVDGDGCPEPVHVDAGVVEVAGERWAVGHPDDAVTFGDWDCDGVATPAVYRPTTGDVFVFPDWAGPGETVTVEPVAQVAGGRSLSAAPTGTCDTPVVELTDGARHTVEVAP